MCFRLSLGQFSTEIEYFIAHRRNIHACRAQAIEFSPVWVGSVRNHTYLRSYTLFGTLIGNCFWALRTTGFSGRMYAFYSAECQNHLYSPQNASGSFLRGSTNNSHCWDRDITAAAHAIMAMADLRGSSLKNESQPRNLTRFRPVSLHSGWANLRSKSNISLHIQGIVFVTRAVSFSPRVAGVGKYILEAAPPLSTGR